MVDGAVPGSVAPQRRVAHATESLRARVACRWKRVDRRWLLVEVGPVVLVIVALIAKQLYFVAAASDLRAGLITVWWWRRAVAVSLGSLGTALVLSAPL